MYRVIIVDDEQWAIRGIRIAFDWSRYGFEVIGETTSSVEALEMICKEQPDLVFTDIKMPEISGLDLMRITKEKGIDTEFIIVSGYAEFSYAQEALRCGALDYCLKPLELDIREKLMEKLYRHFTNKYYLQNNIILEALISNDIQELAHMNSIFEEYTGWHWCVFVIYTDENNRDKIPGGKNDKNILKINFGYKKALYIIKNRSFHELNEFDMEGFLQIDYVSVGISSITDQIEELPKLIKEADIAASTIFVSREKGIFRYSYNMNIVKPIIHRITSTIKGKHFNDVQNIIDEIKELFAGNTLGISEVTYLWNQMVNFIANSSVASDYPELEYLNYSEIKDRFKDFDFFCSYLLELFSHDTQINTQPVGEHDSNSCYEQLLKYVNENYGTELYLKDISKKFFINHAYICRFFKERLGMTFTEYITGLRINKACEMLKNTDFSIEEIAGKVGYSDYYYFNKVFKKECEITPAKYRKLDNI